MALSVLPTLVFKAAVSAAWALSASMRAASSLAILPSAVDTRAARAFLAIASALSPCARAVFSASNAAAVFCCAAVTVLICCACWVLTCSTSAILFPISRDFAVKSAAALSAAA